MKKTYFLPIALLMMGMWLQLSAKPKVAPVETNNDVILHAWCWSFNTIRGCPLRLGDQLSSKYPYELEGICHYSHS